MALVFNGTQVKTVIFNGTQLKKIIKDGVVVFQSGITINVSYTNTYNETANFLDITLSTTESEAMTDSDVITVSFNGVSYPGQDYVVRITKANPSASARWQNVLGLQFKFDIAVNGVVQATVDGTNSSGTHTFTQSIEL